MKKIDMPIEIVTVCPFCGQPHTITVDFGDWLDYQNGRYAQGAFPYLSADDREMLISGICPKCWDSMFDEEEE